MNSSVPYLIRAINEWILDNDSTPYLIVDATMEDVSVPMEYVKDGQIVLNISPKAVRDLSISTEYVMFSGRFAGIAHEVYAPIAAVMGIIAKENGVFSLTIVYAKKEFSENICLESTLVNEKCLIY